MTELSLHGRFDKLEAYLIAKEEKDQLGHRVQYDTTTGRSMNIPGGHCDPGLLDGDGYRVRL